MFADDEKRSEEKRDKMFMPFRFFLGNPDNKDTKPGDDQCEVIILDKSLDDGFARYEHNLQGSDGKWGNHEPCVKEIDDCPLCAKHGDSSLILFLSVLVFKPYVSKKTGERKEYSKMFLPLKRGQYNAFAKLEKIALAKHGTMRGMYLLLQREGGPHSFSTGMPVPLEDGAAFDMYSEKQLVKEFGHKAIISRENKKVLRPENDDIAAYDYKALFPAPDPDELRSRFNVGAKNGSRQQQAETWEEGEDANPSPRTARRPGAAANQAPPTRRPGASSGGEAAPVRQRQRRASGNADPSVNPGEPLDEDDIPF